MGYKIKDMKAVNGLDDFSQETAKEVLKNFLVSGEITLQAAEWLVSEGIMEKMTDDEEKNLRRENLSHSRPEPTIIRPPSLSEVERTQKPDSKTPLEMFDFFSTGTDQDKRKQFWVLMNDIEQRAQIKLANQNKRLANMNIIIPDSFIPVMELSSAWRSIEMGAFPATMDFNSKIVEKVGELNTSGVFKHNDEKNRIYIDLAGTGEFILINIR